MYILLYSLILIACFILLARIVDLFFIASLDKISRDLKLSSDAAGATLMAVGSSAPELFVALFAVFKPGDHQVIGIGSIVGSALFNILFIVGAAALVKKAKLTWQPILRDLIFYLIAVILLLWAIYNGTFSMLNALVFLLVYILYVVAVIYWRKILPYPDVEFEQEEKEGCAEPGLFRQFDRVLCFLFPSKQKYYWVFFISIVIIAALSWVLVEAAVEISALLNIPEAIVALTVLAIGTSVPDLFSSVIVARQGRGDMAVSNAIGSNIFDILIGLGLPFLLYLIFIGGAIDTSVGDLMSSSFILFASVIILFVLLIVGKWRIGKFAGILMLGLYIFYVVREIVLL